MATGFPECFVLELQRGNGSLFQTENLNTMNMEVAIHSRQGKLLLGVRMI
jgi:hypothetical protein